MKKKSRGQNKYFLPELLGGKTLRSLAGSDQLPAINALSIGSAVFQLEQATKISRIRSAVLPIYGARELAYDLDKLSQIIQELLTFTLVKDIKIDFRESSSSSLESASEEPREQADNLCLFSGGTDSYAGMLLAAKLLPKVQGIFCAHSDQARMIHIVHRLERKLPIFSGFRVRKQLVPRIGARGYAQLRGFLYLLCAVGWLHKLGATKLIVTECGPTMYQPQFSPLDAVTMTTHPKVVQLAKSAINLLLGRDVVVTTPFDKGRGNRHFAFQGGSQTHALMCDPEIRESRRDLLRVCLEAIGDNCRRCA
jgi:hypothetical protein